MHAGNGLEYGTDSSTSLIFLPHKHSIHNPLHYVIMQNKDSILSLNIESVNDQQCVTTCNSYSQLLLQLAV